MDTSTIGVSLESNYRKTFKLSAELYERALDHFGRITQPIVLSENNAWLKRFRWGYGDNEDNHFFYNLVTGEETNITEQQFNDDNFTLNSV